MHRFLTALLAGAALAACGVAWSEEPATTPVPVEAVVDVAAPAAPAEAAAPESVPMPSGTLKLVANLEAGKVIFMDGKGEAPACVACHGETGLGDDNMGTPRLADMGFVYLRKQLYEYAADRRTDTTMGVMNGIARALSDQDKADISGYAAAGLRQDALASASNLEEIKAAGVVPVGERHLGKGIVLYGIPERNVPSCKTCHQYNGRGALPIFPTIGGQRYVYLVNQLKSWRDGSRANDPLAAMRVVASKLTDEDIYNVSAYLTSAPPISPGNSRQPHQPVPATAGASAH